MNLPKIITLSDSNLTVILDPTSASTFSVSVAIKAGTRDETPEISGAAHFLEHMAFKGTKIHSKEQIDRQIDLWGCMANAETDKHYTMYYCKVPASEGLNALKLFSDIAFKGLLPDSAMTLEKGVILQEIAMMEDEPDYLLEEVMMKNAYPDQMFGKPTLGTIESIQGMTRDNLFDFREKNYVGNRSAIIVSGKFNEQEILEYCQSISRSLQKDMSYVSPEINFYDGYLREAREQEQLKLFMGFQAFDGSDERKYALKILAIILGGGFSSRLFQEVREKRGLAYSVNAMFETYDNGGIFAVRAGLDPRRIELAMNVIANELLDVCEAVEEHELQRAKTMVKSAIFLNSDDPMKRVRRLSMEWITSGTVSGVNELIANIDSVSCQDVKTIANEIFNRKGIIVNMGDIQHVPSEGQFIESFKKKEVPLA